MFGNCDLFSDFTPLCQCDSPSGYGSSIEKGFFPTYPVQDIKVATSLDDMPITGSGTAGDARWYDISGLELTQKKLLDLVLDLTTVMTTTQKAAVLDCMEFAKNPGLGIRELHKHGITGQGVKMAIIDQPLGWHKEYAEQIIGKVHDINCKETGDNFASMHGNAVASIAVGKHVGVAPEAGLLYYCANNIVPATEEERAAYKQKLNDDYNKNVEEAKKAGKTDQEAETEFAWLKNLLKKQEKEFHHFNKYISNKPYVEALNRILDENEILPPNERVAVVSISWAFDKFAPGYDEFEAAMQRAITQGTLIITTSSLDKFYSKEFGFDINFLGANRNPLGNLDEPSNYEAGSWLKWLESQPNEYKNQCLLVPMDHRTVANCIDGISYRYEGNDGGMSWATPWLAGMYVLAKQVAPEITPEQFFRYALDTSDECRNFDTGTYVGRLINPRGLIKKIQEELK